jgi:hypothetical protein
VADTDDAAQLLRAGMWTFRSCVSTKRPLTGEERAPLEVEAAPPC